MNSPTPRTLRTALTDKSTNAFHRLLLGVGSSGMGQVISAAQAIFLVPLFLHAWGAEGYGRWLVLTALVSYFSMLDLGGQNYIGNLLAIDHARGAMNEFRKRLSEGVSLFTFIALGVLGLLIAVLFGPWGLFFPDAANYLSTRERCIILFLASNYLLSIPGGIYVSAYRATGLFAHGAMLGNILRLINIVFFAAALFYTISQLYFALLFLSMGVMGTTVIVWDSRQKISACRQIRIGLAEANSGIKYLRGALQFWLMTLAGGFNQQGVLLVLAIFASPAIVSLYVTHRTAAGLVGYVGSLLQAPLWPEMSLLWAQNRREELKKVVMSAIRIVMLVSGLAALAMWALIPFLYPLWTGKQLQLQPVLFGIFLVQGILAAGWFTSGWSLLAANHHRMPARWSLANGAATIMLAFLLAPKYGVLGVSLATLLGDVLCGLLVYPKLTGNMLNFSVLHIYKDMLLMLLLLVPIIAVMAICGHFLHGWAYIVAFTTATAVWCMLAIPFALGHEIWRRFSSSGLLAWSKEAA